MSRWQTAKEISFILYIVSAQAVQKRYNILLISNFPTYYGNYQRFTALIGVGRGYSHRYTNVSECQKRRCRIEQTRGSEIQHRFFFMNAVKNVVALPCKARVITRYVKIYITLDRYVLCRYELSINRANRMGVQNMATPVRQSGPLEIRP